MSFKLKSEWYRKCFSHSPKVFTVSNIFPTLIWSKSATSHEKVKKRKKKKQTPIHVQGLFLPLIKVTDLTTVILAILYE